MKSVFAISLAALSLTAGKAGAQGMPLTTISGGDIGIQVSSYHYEEDVNDAYFMSLDGKKLGITGSFNKALPDNWYWGADGRFVSGNVDYDSAGSGTKSANGDSYFEGRVTVGRDFEFGAQVLAPYAGLGYRYLNNDLRGSTTTGASGYRRTSNYIYLPLGVVHRTRAGVQARWSTTLEYDYLIQGLQRSYVTDVTVGGYTSDLENLQRSGYGLRLGLAYEQENWSVGVFYHYWNIARSDTGVYTDATKVYTGYEPHNITTEGGVQLKYRFR